MTIETITPNTPLLLAAAAIAAVACIIFMLWIWVSKSKQKQKQHDQKSGATSLLRNGTKSNPNSNDNDNDYTNNSVHQQHQKSKKRNNVKILGPKAPQEITFLVTTPPSEHIPVLFAGSESKSIRRQLAFNVQSMTWERRKPETRRKARNEPLDDSAAAAAAAAAGGGLGATGSIVDVATHAHVDHPDADAGADADTIWEKSAHDLPIEAVINVSAYIPDRCATVEMTIDTSIVENNDELFIDDLSSYVVTVDNWKTHDADKKKRNTSMGERRKYGPIDIDDDDDDDSVCDASTASILGGGGGGDESIHTAGASSHYRKNNGKVPSSSKVRSKHCEAKKEYTFASEFEAGAFQTLFLAMRTVGPEIGNMYSALEIVHKSSEAHDGDVYSDAVGGVALDDIQRCLGDLSFVGKRIAKIYQSYYADEGMGVDEETDQNANKNFIVSAAHSAHSLEEGDDEGTSLYQSKRMLLGYVDFFRLFIPSVLHGTPYASPVAASDDELRFSDTVDGIDEHQARVRQLIKLRQRVARAAVRVRVYANAMKIVHEGWDLPSASTHQEPRKRLAFDDGCLNVEHDGCTENEYYDPTLSRENMAQTMVTADASFPPCLQQAYSLVGCKMISLPQEGVVEMNGASNFTPSMDPVASISSLRYLVDKNPDNEFFVVSLFHKKQKVMTVSLFVKCLPQGIDEEFDKAFDRFTSGSAEIRDGMLNLSMQVGK